MASGIFYPKKYKIVPKFLSFLTQRFAWPSCLVMVFKSDVCQFESQSRQNFFFKSPSFLCYSVLQLNVRVMNGYQLRETLFSFLTKIWISSKGSVHKLVSIWSLCHYKFWPVCKKISRKKNQILVKQEKRVLLIC